MMFSDSIHKQLIPDFADYGISLERFFVTGIVKPDGERQYEKFKELHFRQYADIAEAKLRQQTDIIHAQTLMAQAKSPEAKAECKKVYEAVRYSDPVSSDALASLESQITVKFSDFSSSVTADDSEHIAEIAKELVVLIGDRNNKCKLLE